MEVPQETESKVVELPNEDQSEESSDTDSFHSIENQEEEEEEKDDPIPELTGDSEEGTDIKPKTDEEAVPLLKQGEGDITKALEYKMKGNEMFKWKEYIEALDYYNQAIWYWPDSEQKQLSVFYNNKGIVFIQLEKDDEALKWFEESLKYNEDYLKPRFQRMKILKKKEDYTAAIEDAKFILQKDSNFGSIQYELKHLEKLEKEKMEKMKDEVLGNLKNLGNSILGKFGMSLDNFKLNQNPDGTYNINMGQ